VRAGPRWYPGVVVAPSSGAPDHAPAPPRLTYLVKRLELAVRAAMDDIVGELGVTVPQYTALSVLERHPGMSSAQLARRSFVSRQAGGEMLASLERKGLVRRAPDTGNRRVLRISLTRAGRTLLAACDAAMDDLEDRMLLRLSDAERQRLRALLDACTVALAPRDEAPGHSGAWPAGAP
jgi:DNA-binding MarR family transcriptional regulator